MSLVKLDLENLGFLVSCLIKYLIILEVFPKMVQLPMFNNNQLFFLLQSKKTYYLDIPSKNRNIKMFFHCHVWTLTWKFWKMETRLLWGKEESLCQVVKKQDLPLPELYILMLIYTYWMILFQRLIPR